MLTEGINVCYSPKQPVSVLVIKLGSFPPSPLQILPADLKRKYHYWEAVSNPLGKKLALHKAAQTGLSFLNGNSKSWFKKRKQIVLPGRLQGFIPIKLLRCHRAFAPL